MPGPPRSTPAFPITEIEMKLSISPEVLSMLVCPETGLALHLATTDELSHWTHETPFEGALLSEDGSKAYPVRNGFPVLIKAEALTKKNG